MRVLVVDDVADNAELLHRWLKRRKHTPLIARNGQEAVELAIAERPDLVFMDISMPIMCGLEATRMIRANDDPVVADTPIIALTAHAMASDRDDCLNAGCNDVATKPVDFTRLAEILAFFDKANTHLAQGIAQ